MKDHKRKLRRAGQKLKREQKQEPWENGAYCLVLHDLLSQLSYIIQDHLPWAAPWKAVWDVPPTSSIRKMKLTHWPICWGQFLS